MKLICVGGLSSGCGKTSVVCLLLKALPGWAAIKVTPSRPNHVCPHGKDCEACQPPDGPYDVAIDSDIPARPGKDTSRFHDAGASHVAFVRALPECLPAALESAFERFNHPSRYLSWREVPGVIIESTTAMPFIDGLRILVAREGRLEVKDSARAAAGIADLLVVNGDASNPVDGVMRRAAFCPDAPFAAELPAKRITVCASLPPEHPCNRDLIADCRLFLERSAIIG